MLRDSSAALSVLLLGFFLSPFLLIPPAPHSLPQSPFGSHSPPLRLPTVGFERDLQHAIAEGEAVEVLDCNQCFFVVGHGNEAEALALARSVVADDLDTLHRPEWAEELPENGVLGVRG